MSNVSLQNWPKVSGTPSSREAHSPTRKARRTRRGWRAPKACAAKGATACMKPMPSVKPTKRTVWASAAAATTLSPRRPSSIRSVVIMLIWPSWVSAIGAARRMVSRISARQMALAANAPAPAAVALLIAVMPRTIGGFAQKKSTGPGRRFTATAKAAAVLPGPACQAANPMQPRAARRVERFAPGRMRTCAWRCKRVPTTPFRAQKAMPAFRLGALRDLFGKSDNKRGKGAERAPASQGRLALVQGDPIAVPPKETQEVEVKSVARAVRKPAEPANSYTAADIEVLEGLEPVRRRPGMYIGGTDEKALHHLFAEVIDNCMDEAVAGHATWIEVRLEADGFLSVTDNGRGIPVDPHPKFKSKSALEVIMTTLHSGGKFDSKVYNTSGGLHGVGVSVVNALSEKLEVEVARGQQLYAQQFARGAPLGKLKSLGAIKNRRGTKVRFKPDEKIFGKAAAFRPQRLLRMARSKAYLFGGVEIRWTCARSLITDDTPDKATFHFPGGLKEYLEATINGQTRVTRDLFAGRIQNDGHGSVEWAVCWIADADGFLNSYCNTIPTPEGGTHENGLRPGPPTA